MATIKLGLVLLFACAVFIGGSLYGRTVQSTDDNNKHFVQVQTCRDIVELQRIAINDYLTGDPARGNAVMNRVHNVQNNC